MKNEPFVIEKTMQAPAEKVWSAITDKDQMKKWYFDLKEFKPQPGFEFQFEAGKDDKTYLHICQIKEVETFRKLSYSWRYEGYEGESLVTFQLFLEGDTTRVELIHEGLETFTTDNPDFAPESFAAGWTYIIGKSLPEFVENPQP